VDVLADDGVQRALVAVAHPDDADFWAGGTVARWSAAGILVTYLVLTDGDAGGFDPAVPRADIPRIRRSEQQAAARILGVRDVRFLRLAEGTIVQGVELLNVTGFRRCGGGAGTDLIVRGAGSPRRNVTA
jgi:LmbE family N-acetylglucosaminyl deacetylase